jgi:hypothetical protein
MPDLELLSVVALLQDVPEYGLTRGQVGTIVELLSDSAFEVEFVDEEGHTYAMLALTADQLVRLHYKPLPQAA